MRTPFLSLAFFSNPLREVRHFGRGRRRGQALVEMAMAILILIPILMGILEFGILARENLLIANASREGARGAALGKTAEATKTRAANAMTPLSPTLVTLNDRITLQYSTDADTATIPTWLAWPADVSTTNGNINGVPNGAMIRVTVATTHISPSGFFGFLRNRTFTQSTSMKREASGRA